MEHPTEDVLLRFALCAASRQENRQVVRHLLARCPSCAETVRKLRKEPPQDPPIAPDAYDPALDRLIALARELSPHHPAPPPRPAPFFLVRQCPGPDAGEDGRPLASAASASDTPKQRSG